MKELQPVNQNVLLELPDSKAEQKTALGIIIPDEAKEKETIAKVAALGQIENPEFAVGDMVMYKDFSGSKVHFEGKDYLFLPYSDILAKLVVTESI